MMGAIKRIKAGGGCGGEKCLLNNRIREGLSNEAIYEPGHI